MNLFENNKNYKDNENGKMKQLQNDEKSKDMKRFKKQDKKGKRRV